jgi:hypothetical protein
MLSGLGVRVSVSADEPSTDNWLMKTLSRIVRVLKYPTYKQLAVERALMASAGNVMMGAGNLHAVVLGAVHIPGTFVS